MRSAYSLLLLAVFVVFFCVNGCFNGNASVQSDSPYFNHHDSVKYLGIEACKNCHSDKFETFLHTGMGQSFDLASTQKSAASFHAIKPVYDSISDLYYVPYWENQELYIKEFRLLGKDTIHKLIEKIDYIIGSGQHTNSHLINRNGYLFQAPLTWYAQKKQWDLPPGFENGNNSRFSRLIGLECLSCHNAIPGFYPQSENRYFSVPQGIDCERCHGPGELHVKNINEGKVVDISRAIDFSIVNPAKLSWDLQIDVCQRCHLQGNAVLKENKTYTDFKPGMPLSSVMDVFMPKYAGDNSKFIMASHAERLQMSACFTQSNKQNDAGVLKLTCITCHNPHVSVKVTGTKIFNDACIKCHTTKDACSASPELRLAKNNDCSGCHMPLSGTIDIPHVSVHDHYIRKNYQKPDAQEKLEAKFVGIAPVNKTQFDALIYGRAYLQFYERFDNNRSHLDSAWFYLKQAKNNTEDLIHYYYLKNDFKSLVSFSKKYLAVETSKSQWTAYRIGKAHQNLGNNDEALQWFDAACNMAPDNIEFVAEKAALLLTMNQWPQAEKLLQKIIRLQPSHTAALGNLGWVYLNQSDYKTAKVMLEKALQTNPDYIPAKYNLAVLLQKMGKPGESLQLAEQILKQNPKHQGAKNILEGN